MKIVLKAIREDIKAAALAFEREDFDNMNIFANRIMANAIFGTKNNLFLPGFFLKDIALAYGSLKVTKEAAAFSTAKSFGTSYIEKLIKLFPGKDLDEEKLWQQYYDFCCDLRKFQMNEFEAGSYSSNHEFTKSSFRWLVEYLGEKKEILLDPKNRLLKGLLNEMERIFRVHGGELSDLLVMSMVRALDRYYDYLRIAYGISEERLKREMVEKDLFSYIGDIRETVSTSQFDVLKVDAVLWKLTKRWREFFIEYMELRRPRVAIEKGIEIPKETKEKLVKSMTETLEKEIRVGKK